MRPSTVPLFIVRIRAAHGRGGRRQPEPAKASARKCLARAGAPRGRSKPTNGAACRAVCQLSNETPATARRGVDLLFYEIDTPGRPVTRDTPNFSVRGVSSNQPRRAARR